MLQPEDQWADLPKTRKEALEVGAKKYFTGKPCTHGHMVFRATSSGVCSLCRRNEFRKWVSKNRDSVSAKKAVWQREYRAKNKDSLAVKRKAYAEKNREKIRAQGAAYRLKNREKIRAQGAAYWLKKKESASG